jgi:hypothetical protein
MSIRVATPNTLETMIEYTLIANILNKICKMIRTPLEYPRDPTLQDPFKHLLEIRTWGTKWKRENYVWQRTFKVLKLWINFGIFLKF